MGTKNCQKCKKDFSIEAEDSNFYEMMKVPAPTFCPECRFQRRLTFRNDRTLYKRTCEVCQQSVLSVYRPDGGTKVVCQKCWWSDDFDARKYGREYDFSKSFFEQYKALMSDVPFVANFIVDESRMINSPYNNMVLDLRNCYMMFNSDFDEDCAYGCEVENSRTCLDTNLIEKGEMCYECVNITNCYRAFYSVDCESSSDIWFSRDCNGCTDCFGCVNLRQQKYCIFNQPMGSLEAYKAKLAELGLDSRKSLEEIKGKAHLFWKQGIVKFMHEKLTDKVSGDYLYNSKNVIESWIVQQGWNLKYCQYLVAPNVKESYDYTQFGNNVERHYEVLQGGNGGSNVRFSWFTVNENSQVDYCMQVMTSKEMFGCVGLRGKQYCILNKEYSKEEYSILRAKIIEQMSEIPYIDTAGIKYSYGEFFPTALSPFSYNETTAQEFFPLEKETALKNNFTWFDREERDYKPTIMVNQIPDTIKEITEEILKDIIQCANTGKDENCTTAFRIITNELSFYQRFNIPLPTKCPNCRHKERMAFRTMPNFRKTICAEESCDNQILTAYPESATNVYCKQHYLGRVA